MSKYTRPNEGELRKILNPTQYRVTQEDGTEMPFQNEYWDHEEEVCDVYNVPTNLKVDIWPMPYNHRP